MSSPRCLGVLLCTCTALLAVGTGWADPGDVASVARSNNCFALNLYASVKDQTGNLFLSPYSISVALAMTYSGARGETADQMATVLCFREETEDEVIQSSPRRRSPPIRDPRLPRRRLFLRQTVDQSSDRPHDALGRLMDELNGEGQARGYELAIANSLWGQDGYPFRDEFLELIDAYYDGTFYPVNFVLAPEPARQQINAWVAERTHDRIPELLPVGVVNSSTRLVLANAIYFKSAWLAPFKERATTDQPFFLTTGESVDVRMMTQRGAFNYLDADGFQVLELFYENSDLSMVILLPDEANGLPSLEESFSTDNLARWLAALRPLQLVVTMPKFQIANQFRLAPVLIGMGMPLAFLSADFSGMTGGRELSISAVAHDAFVEVDESGTEAAAATAVINTATSVPPPPRAFFVADHPFLFLIRDVRTGTILFLGRISDPS